MKDPYQILGVAKTATDSSIKKAYRALAKKYHPDLAPNDKIIADKFKEVSAAYDILGDTDKRAQFDRGEIDALGNPRYPFSGGRNGNADPFGDGFGFGFDLGGQRASRGAPDDIFSDFFSQRRQERRAAPQKGRDMEYQVEISFEDSIRGVTKPVRLSKDKKLNVKIPPSMEDGQIIRLKAQGLPGLHGGRSGDALVKVLITHDPDFRRVGDNIEAAVSVPLSTAVLGGKITIRTVDGPVSVTVPRQSSSGTRLRLKGKGIVRKDGTRGDQFAVVQIILPDPPDPELERLLAQRGNEHNYTI